MENRTQGPPHILLVDDDAMVRAALEEFLCTLGYRVSTAENGSQAIDILVQIQEPIRLLITDIRMPVMDGIELIRLVRQDRAELPIAVISGYADEAQVVATGDQHIVHFSKPMNFTEIAQFLDDLQG